MAWREEEPPRAGEEHRSFAHSAVVSEQGAMGGVIAASPAISGDLGVSADLG